MRRAALLLGVALCACGERVEGVEIELSVTVQPPASTAVKRARLGVSTVEFHRCPGAAANALRWLSPISTAWAHGGGHGGARLAPVEIDLLSLGPQVLGSVNPPAGRYCHFVVELGPVGNEPGATLAIDDTTSAGAPRALATARLRSLGFSTDFTLDEAQREAAVGLELDASALGAEPASADQALDALAAGLRLPRVGP